ncbi:methylenetetrahydrofolate reductase [Thermodesulfobacteriota bacterium]
MRVTDIWASGGKPTISFELLPARSIKAAENLNKAIDKLAAMNPDFVSVTFGAGGSTREGSRQLIEKLKNENDLEVVAYFAGYGLGPDDISAVLDSYKALGIETILVVRGDPPHDQEGFEPHPQSLPYASDMVEFIRSRYDFCIGVAGYPEGHIEAESREKDLEYLKLKVDKGAEYIICNYYYDNRYFFDFIERCETAGIDVPILAGVMPIYSTRMLEKLAGLCGATITNEVRGGIAALPEDDKEALVDFGIDFATRQCEGLLKAGVPGLHIYTMNRSVSAVGIVERLRKTGLV